MNTIEISAFKSELDNLNNCYYKLLIVCGANRDPMFTEMIEDLKIPTINLNLELSKALLEIPINRRSRKVREIVEKIIWDCHSNKIYFNHIELLFHPDLNQDPLKLFLPLSRNKTLIISWTGEYKSGILTFAEFGHPEYKAYREVEAKIISIGE